MNAPTNDFTIDGKTYQLRTRKCGKKDCKCQRGEEHGPYWYVSNGSLKYVGKNLPDDVLRHLELRDSQRKALIEIQNQASERAQAAYDAYTQANEESKAIQALLWGNYTRKEVLQRLGLERFIVE